MLRNSYIDNYSNNNKKLKSPKHKDCDEQDIRKIINSSRPMSPQKIRSMSSKILPTFIDDIMCNKDVNTLLYSSNAKKEKQFYIKEKKNILKFFPLKKNSFLLGEGTGDDKYLKAKNDLAKMMITNGKVYLLNFLKKTLNNFQINKSNYMRKMRIKNDEFLKEQSPIAEILKYKYYKPVNEIRLKGYQRAFKKCLNLSIHSKNFDLPDSQFNMKNVYSRLFNNQILSQNYMRSKSATPVYKDNITTKEYDKNKNDSFSTTNKKMSFRLTDKRKSTRKKTRVSSKKSTKLVHTYSSLKENENKCKIKYNVYNLIKNYKGREFSLKVTPRIHKKCWCSISGGPKSNRFMETNEEENSFKLKENNKKKKSKSEAILYNTLFSDSESIDKDGREVVNVKNFRDTFLNSSLHIAVINKSVKLVKYFLDKSLDVNVKNNLGKTPLHLAMKSGNKKIIDMLLAKGADTKAVDNDGNMPIDLASKELKSYYQQEQLH